jgi:hypothetical protein
MADSNGLVIGKVDGGVIIQGHFFTSSAKRVEGNWVAHQLDRKRILITPDYVEKELGNVGEEFAKCKIGAFTSFLLGLSVRKFSGCLVIDTGKGIKRIYFKEGEICFASSNLIDDRLGEIIYRGGHINIEQLAQSSAKVNRNMRFGTVLLKSGIFSTLDLWNALKVQIFEIIKSIFLVDSVYFQTVEGNINVPSNIVFEEPSLLLFQKAALYGASFRCFLEQISPDSIVAINTSSKSWKEPEPGVFEYDIVQLIRENGTIGKVIENSKFIDINTLNILFDFSNRRLITVGANQEPDESLELSAQIKSQVMRYNMLMDDVLKLFETEELIFPIEDVYKLLDQISMGGLHLLGVDEAGRIPAKIQNALAELIDFDKNAAHLVENYCASLFQFVLQIAGDLLSRDSSKLIREKYK